MAKNEAVMISRHENISATAQAKESENWATTSLHAPTTMLTWLRALFNTTPLRIWKKLFPFQVSVMTLYFFQRQQWGKIDSNMSRHQWVTLFFVTRSFATRLMSPFLKSNCLNKTVNNERSLSFIRTFLMFCLCEAYIFTSKEKSLDSIHTSQNRKAHPSKLITVDN